MTTRYGTKCGLCRQPLPFHDTLCPSYIPPRALKFSYEAVWDDPEESLQDAYEKVEDSYRSWRGL